MDSILPLKELDKYYLSKEKSDEQRILFFSVGSAANLKCKKIQRIRDRDMHQYPPFIQHLKNIGPPTLELDIFLIDPWLKNEPYLVQYLREYGITVIQDDQISNIYHGGNINIYVFKEPVCYEGCNFYEEKTFDITPLLFNFNQYCIKRNDLLIFHDFSGRDTWLLAEYFDKIICNHSNRILYDITMRSQGSCSVDLENPLYFLQTNHDEIITLTNPFGFDNRTLVNIIQSNNDNILKVQFTIPIIKRIRIFRNFIFPLLRRFLNHKNDISKGGFDINTFTSKVYVQEFFFVDKKIELGLFDTFLEYQKTHDVTKVYDIITKLKEVIKQWVLDFNSLIEEDIENLENLVELQVDQIENDLYGWLDKFVNNLKIQFQKRGIIINEGIMTNYL